MPQVSFFFLFHNIFLFLCTLVISWLTNVTNHNVTQVWWHLAYTRHKFVHHTQVYTSFFRTIRSTKEHVFIIVCRYHISLTFFLYLILSPPNNKHLSTPSSSLHLLLHHSISPSTIVYLPRPSSGHCFFNKLNLRYFQPNYYYLKVFESFKYFQPI